MSKAPDLNGTGMTSARTRARLAARLREQGIMDESVLEVIESIPRHIFIDEALAHRAYEDTALPIGFNQTISQPWVVARMTEVLLAHGIPGRVLEVGTGSGYQAAVLARLVPKVYSVERIAPLIEKARDRFRLLGLSNVMLRHSDGGMGWPERGPFDAILLTASPRRVPAELFDQLAVNGCLVAPGGDDDDQTLMCYVRTDDGVIETPLGSVRFVPLVSGVTG